MAGALVLNHIRLPYSTLPSSLNDTIARVLFTLKTTIVGIGGGI